MKLVGIMPPCNMLLVLIASSTNLIFQMLNDGQAMSSHAFSLQTYFSRK
jgi:hypothetical protein